MSGLTSSVMVMKLWVLVPLIVQVYLVKFPGDCYQSMVGVLLQGVMVWWVSFSTTYKYYSSDDDFQIKSKIHESIN